MLRIAAKANTRVVENVRKFLGGEEPVIEGQLHIQFESKKANPKNTEGPLQLLLFIFSINGITLFSITSITLEFKPNESKR